MADATPSLCIVMVLPEPVGSPTGGHAVLNIYDYVDGILLRWKVRRRIGLEGPMTLVCEDEPGREMLKVGRSDGASRIWICDGSMPKGRAVGLHRHGGDEIFHVTQGTIRFHLDGKNIDVGPGHYVVVPPYTEHGFKILTDDVHLQFIGEIGMGEWVTVIDPGGTRRQVEVRSTIMPWHRPPLEGEKLDIAEMFAMLQSTSHLLDDEPEEEDHAHQW
jgi:quercetin dioxygenase-like cupin family protein